MAEPKYFYILGPSGVGKTELSILLAKQLKLPIVNCDSVQVYKHVNIGTAKPTIDERTLADHFLFDYVSAKATLTASGYVENVVETISENNFKNIIFVGGSGFYIQALEKGMFPNSETSVNIKNEVNLWIEKEGISALYSWLLREDPVFAEKLSPNDHYRISRAVEVMKTQNKKMSELKIEMEKNNYSKLEPHQTLKIGLRMEKSLLRKRIEERTHKMLSKGLIDEVKGLLDQGLEDWSPMSSVGYKETVSFLKGELTRDELYERIVVSTMQLIKKQMTWFKRDKEINWFEVGNEKEALSMALDWSKKA